MVVDLSGAEEFSGGSGGKGTGCVRGTWPLSARDAFAPSRFAVMNRTDSAKRNYICVPYVLSRHSVIGDKLSAKIN